jgi:hypothetical protein
MIPSAAASLGKAVNRWLSFQAACGRRALLSEAYLAQPIGEFLIHHVQRGELRAEFNHPNLTAGGKGRPRQIDYALFSPERRRLTAVIEAKWVTDVNTDTQRLVNDLLRLECVRNQERQMVHRYFLVAGATPNVETHLREVELNTGQGRVAFIQQLLSFDVDQSRVDVDVFDQPETTRRFFRTFAKEYKVQIPTGFATTLAGTTTDDDFAVLIWRITSSRHRTVFEPKADWG